MIPLRPRAPWGAAWSSRSARLQFAAALAIAAAGISTVAVVRHNGAPQQASVAAVGGTNATAARTDQGVALVATADLSDAELATLIKDMDSMQALPPAEPEPIAPAVDGGV